MRQRRISRGKAEIISERDVISEFGFSGAIRQIRFNRRYYTVYGRCFAVAGKNIHYSAVQKMRHYSFLDWNNLSNMVAE